VNERIDDVEKQRGAVLRTRGDVDLDPLASRLS
jgi:hypothetical protein